MNKTNRLNRKIKVCGCSLALLFCISYALFFSAVRQMQEAQYCVELKHNVLPLYRQRNGKWPSNMSDIKRYMKLYLNSLSSRSPSEPDDRYETYIGQIENESRPELILIKSDDHYFRAKITFHWLLGHDMIVEAEAKR